MKRIIAAIAGILVLLEATSAIAQQLPFTLPPNTVVGRTSIGPGEATAIPFDVLASTLSQFGLLTGPLTLADFPAIGANTVLGSVAGGTPTALSSAQFTAMINPATATLPGALPAWPNNTTTFFRGDGTYATLNVAAIGGLGTSVATALGNAVNGASGLVGFSGNLGTPLAGVATNLTGTAAGLTAGNVSTNANLTGPITSVGNATSVTNNSITNAMRATMAAHTVKGNNGGSTANEADLTIPQLAAQFTAPTTQTFLSSSGTYTTPANVTWIQVVVQGGGGGGTGSGTSPGRGGNGVASTFGTSLLTANGGLMGRIDGGITAGGTATGGDDNITGGSGAQGGGGVINAPGGNGGSSPRGGFGGSAQGGVGVDAVPSTGSGGGGAGSGGTTGTGGGGSAGGWLRKIIAAPSATYSYAIGGGGAAGTAGTGGFAGGAGGSGFIQVVEHYN